MLDQNLLIGMHENDLVVLVVSKDGHQYHVVIYATLLIFASLHDNFLHVIYLFGEEPFC